MAKSVTKNYLYNVCYQILILITPLITTPYISRVLRPEGVGTYAYTSSISHYFVLFGAIGLNLYGQREIAYLHRKGRLYSKTFFEIIVVRFLTLGISLGIYIFAFCREGEDSLYYRILIIEIVAAMFDISWLFQGLEDFKRTVTRNVIVKILGIILIFALVKTQSDLWIYTLIQVGVILIGNLSLWLYLPRVLKRFSFRKINFLRHIRPAIVLFLPQIAISLYTILDKTMIGAITGDKSEVAFYEQSQKIVKVVLAIVTSMGTVMLPRIAKKFADRDTKKIKLYIYDTFSMVFMIAVPLVLGLIGISRGLVPWFFEKGYDKVTPNMMIISPIILLVGLSNVIGMQYLLPTRRQKAYTTSVVAGAVINFILNLILIPKYMSLGAAIATVLAELTVTVIQMIAIHRDFDLKGVLFGAWKYFLSGGIMFAVVWWLQSVLEISAMSTIIEIASGAIVYVLLLFVLRDEMIKRFMMKAKKVGKK